MVELRSPSKTELVERVKAILASKGLTLYQVSQRARSLYGRSSPYFLPHNLYYDLGLRTFSPSLHQLFALSKISDYRFNDWLQLFGFNTEDISRLQILLSSKRTMLLDCALDDPERLIPWFQNRLGNAPAPAIAPIGQLLDLAAPRLPWLAPPYQEGQLPVCKSRARGRFRISGFASGHHRARRHTACGDDALYPERSGPEFFISYRARQRVLLLPAAGTRQEPHRAAEWAASLCTGRTAVA